MRLLVLDQSRILQWLVLHEFPQGLEVLAVQDFDEAERLVEQDPPDAAVVSLPPAQLPWRQFQHLCARRKPPVPVLYESCLHSNGQDVGLDPEDGYAVFLPKPAPRSELRAAIEALIAEALRHRCEETLSDGTPFRASRPDPAS